MYHPASLHLPKTAKRAAKEHGIRMISGERTVIDGHPAWLLMVPDIGSMYTKKMAAQIEAMFAEEDAFS